jgi:hypothetical protein
MSGTSSNAVSNTASASAARSGYGTGTITPINGDALSWGSVDPMLLQDCVKAVNDCGDGVSLAKGARGDWISITVLADGDRPRWTARSVEEAQQYLVDITNAARKRGR